MPPTALIDALQGVRRRVRLLSVLYGVGIVIAAIPSLLIITVLLDYLLNLPPTPRLFVIAIALVILARLLGRWVMRPAVTPLGLADLAGKIERAFPVFDDRLRSTVDFVGQETPESREMKDRVMSEAAELASKVDLNRAIQMRPLWQSFTAAGGAMAIALIISAMVGHEYLSVAMTRLLTPFDGRPWPKSVQIQMVGDLPQRVAAGQNLDVRIKLTRGDRPSREARVYYQYGSGAVEREIMVRGPDGVYSASLDTHAAASAAGTMKIWMEAGDDATQPQTVTVVPRLAIVGVQCLVTPPAYAGQSTASAPLDSVPITVVYGSSVSLKLTFNKDLSTSQPVVLQSEESGGALPAVTWDAVSGPAAVGHWVAMASTTFQVKAFDTDGLPNGDMTDYQIIVRPDQPPTIQITRPARNEECTPQAVIPLRAIAEDDFGIKSLKLMVIKLGDKPIQYPPMELIRDGQVGDGVVWNQLDAAGDVHRWQLDYPWDLSKMDSPALKTGDVIEYYLSVQDNFDFQGQQHDPVSSGRYRITIMSQDQFTSLMGDLMAQVRENLVEIRNSQRGLKQQTTDLRNDTQKQKQFSHADIQQADQLVDRQTTAASQARQSAERLNDILARMEENKSTAQDLKEIASSVRDDLNEVAEHAMKDAAAQIGDAKSKPTDARNDTLDAAQENQQTAADKLDQMVSRLGEVGGLPEAIRSLREILSHQREIEAKSNDVGMKNLGKTPDQMDPKDAQAQKENAAAQSSLADKMQKALDQLNSSARKLQKSDPTSSQAMQQAAQTGQQQDVVSQMRNSADQQKQNQQSGAQNAQSQVEVGLQMMLRELEEAQRAKLEALARHLADIQQQLNELIRQQASLNYQNLSLRGASTLKAIDAKVIVGLLSDAQWAADQIPPVPDLDTQTRLETQTEHNSRSIGKMAEALPDGAQIVANLGRAADRMGRAITFLRDDESSDTQRLSGAYDPSQVEALTALRAAKELVDAQAAKNAEALNQQKRDTIRAAYEKILEAQKKIDVDTVTIDQSPRTSDGQLSHRQAVRMAQLPPEQGGLADRISKLESDLSALGSIVYVWANKDIADTMKLIQTDLAVPKTGVATQAEQTRVEEQLQAMIDSLKIQPKKIPFAQQGSGGGGGSGKPKPSLPAEAELRLLQRLQQSVNKSTKKINDAGNPAEPALVALGERQHDLRNLLDQLLQKASRGQMKLGPEPSPDQKVPEEAGANKEDAALEQDLLHDNGRPGQDAAAKDVALIGDRMGRAHQRLASDHDPGQITQDIQQSIVKNLDTLIDIARQQQAESQSQPGSPQQQQATAQNQSKNGQPNNSGNNPTSANQNGGHTPASVHTAGHEGDATGTPNTDITQTLKEWGSLSPRKRAAVIEAGSEKPIEKYKSLIDDYYRALGIRSGETDNQNNQPANGN